MDDPIEFILNLHYDNLPDDIVRAAIRALTDTLGVAVAGSKTQLSTIIRNHASEHFGAGSNMPASLWSDGRPVSAAGAALANGMTIDSVDAHDGQKLTKGHVGCGVVPALIALTESTGQTDVEEFLTALVIGYEIGSRAGIALHSSVTDYHTSGAWVALATAALGARYLKLNREQTRHALGIAEYHGPRSQMMRTIDHPTMVKDGSGWGSMAGVSAAFLARDGFTGAPAISMEAPQVHSIWADLQSHWYIAEQYIKLYPVCRWAQPPVEAALALQREHGFAASDIASIDVETFHEAKRLCTRHPKTTEEAQYSTSFPCAVAMVRGQVTAADIGEDALQDAEILRLSKSTTMHEDTACNDAFPKERHARVGIVLKDGTRLESDLHSPRWDHRAPPSDAELEAKFHDLADPVLGRKRSEGLRYAVRDLADAPLSHLTDQLFQPIN